MPRANEPDGACADVRLPQNRLFFPLCIFFLVVWLTLLAVAPKLIPLFSVVAVCIVWAAYRLPLAGTTETLMSFFLYERQMPKNEFLGTLITTNVGFFSSVAFSTLLIFSLGIGPALLSIVAWLVGLWWFSRQLPKLMPFLKKGSTIHEYIGVSYGRTPKEIRKLALYSSIITFLLYVASVGVEIKYSADVFSTVARVPSELVALTLCISGIFYVAVAGYRGVVSTDRVRLWAVLSGVAAIYIFIAIQWSREPITWPSEIASLQSLTMGAAPATLISIMILLVLYQFCVMDMWERCIAIAHTRIEEESGDQSGTGNTELSDQDMRIVRTMQSIIARRSVLPFVLLFSAWYGIGLLALLQGWTQDPSQIIPALFQKVEAFAVTDPIPAYVIETTIIVCFLSAALSTIDGFLVAAVQTVMFDWLDLEPKRGNSVSPSLETRYVFLSRLLIIACGGVAVLLAFVTFDLLSFWVGMYSLMLSFFPPIWLSLRRRSAGPKAAPGTVAVAIILGSGVSLGMSIWGTFVKPDTLLTAASAAAAVTVSYLVMVAGAKAKAA